MMQYTIGCLETVKYKKRYQFKSKFLLAFFSNFILIFTAYAECCPLTPSELINESDLVLTGEIVSIQVSTENSHIEKDSGNYDWAIDLTIKITNIEKGRFDESDAIVVRCFRIKSRNSMLGYFSPSGNDPMPDIGTIVRAHLYRSSDLWRVVYPNGLTSVSEGVELTNADILHELKNNWKSVYFGPLKKSRSTYFLILAQIGAIVLWSVFVIRVINWLFRRGLLREDIINPEEISR